MWYKCLTVRTIMAEEFQVAGFWDIGDEEGGQWGKAEGLQNRGKVDWKRIGKRRKNESAT